MSQFDSRLLVEGVRAIEGVTPTQHINSCKSADNSFEALLIQRAKEQDNNLQISSLFAHFKALTKNIYRLFAFILFILGALAVKNMLFTEQLASVNFFWAFALFFIPNLIMFCAWLVLFLKPSLLQNSSLTRFTLSAIKLIERRFNKEQIKRNNYWTLFSCYFELHFSKSLGRYKLSQLTHLLWLSYFCGALAMSVLMLATHQVDFIWQTSILSSESFQSLTQLLAYLPHKLGFIVPSIEQIQQSHLSIENLVDADNRRLAWSSLLISSLLLYGALPRLLLYFYVSYQFRQVKVRYNLDLSLPYYVQLRQLLKPNKATLGITDADDEEGTKKHVDNVQYTACQSVPLPRHFYPLAIELSGSQFSLAKAHLKSVLPELNVDFVNVCDHSQQQRLLSEIKLNANEDVVLYVALNRLPDRGLKRFVSQLTAIANKQYHLFLLIDNKRTAQRDNDWYRLADSVGIQLDNILHVDVQGDNNE